MTTSNPTPDPGAKGSGMLHEADIGSGERSPGQQETDQMIKEIPPLHGKVPDSGAADDEGTPAKG
jgi:hypothetical protein